MAVYATSPADQGHHLDQPVYHDEQPHQQHDRQQREVHDLPGQRGFADCAVVVAVVDLLQLCAFCLVDVDQVVVAALLLLLRLQVVGWRPLLQLDVPLFLPLCFVLPVFSWLLAWALDLVGSHDAFAPAEVDALDVQA